MAQEKDERGAAILRKSSDGGDDALNLKRTAANSRSAHRESGNGVPQSQPSGKRPERYMIGTRTCATAQAFVQPQHTMDDVVTYLDRQGDVEVLKRLKLGGIRPFTVDGRSTTEIVVATIDETKAQRLRAGAPPDLIIERDSMLACADYLPLPGRAAQIGTLLPLRCAATDVVIRVIGDRDQPLARATVVVDGGGLPAQALTDETGTAKLTFFGGSLDEIQMLFIRSAANHWDRVVPAPQLTSGTNTIKLQPLSELYSGFPGARLLGWGQRLMGIDPSSGRFTGAGVRIGIIDSGCDTTHPLLRHVTRGKDFTAGSTDTSWTQDSASQGTHCAGIINASGSDQGIIGCAPEAELHILKVIPEGRVSDLLAALDECIERELDVIHISVVTDGFSELVSQKLQEARQKGITCIAAAGTAGGCLVFPASLPGGVMAVAAIGRLKQFPADSSHVLNVIPQLIGSDGLFAARFSGSGPRINVGAPGVAIVSTVPGGGYVAADGTPAAAAHVTGFAALVLAHHPLFQREGLFALRNEQRVQAVLDLIQASALPHFLGPQYIGWGVPDLSRVPGDQSFGMGLTSGDGAERVAPNPYRVASDPGWSWPSGQQPPRYY
ncbi:MAG: S8 family serine peptidase [Steroidobacteraceae bacterium]